MDRYRDILRETPLFAGIAEKELPLMLKCLNGFVRCYQKGEYISIEKEEVKNVGVVLKGAVDMMKEDVWGNSTILVRIPPRKLFGETFACSEDSSAEVTFCAARDTEVLFLPFARVMRSCNNSCVFHHRLIENMVKLIAGKNRELMEKIEVITRKSLREKILSYLSHQAQSQGTRYFEIPLGRAELADYLCADRSALTRELNTLRDEGILDYDRNVFQLMK